MVEPDISLAIGIIALLWTIYQQYSIQNLCANCPFRKDTINQENKITTENPPNN